jgi:hypothetical protein
MPIRVRKLAGAAVLFVFITIYALVVMVLGDVLVRNAPWYGQLAFFVVFGLIWVLPAGLIIRFMQAPPRQG